jgi:hypothetical protein
MREKNIEPIENGMLSTHELKLIVRFCSNLPEPTLTKLKMKGGNDIPPDMPISPEDSTVNLPIKKYKLVA